MTILSMLVYQIIWCTCVRICIVCIYEAIVASDYIAMIVGSTPTTKGTSLFLFLRYTKEKWYKERDVEFH